MAWPKDDMYKVALISHSHPGTPPQQPIGKFYSEESEIDGMVRFDPLYDIEGTRLVHWRKGQVKPMNPEELAALINEIKVFIN